VRLELWQTDDERGGLVRRDVCDTCIDAPGRIRVKAIVRAHAFAVTAVALVTMAHAATASQPAPEPQVVNAMPAFWAFESELGSMKTPERIARLFRQKVIQPHWVVYSKSEFKKNITDEGITDYLKQTQPDLGAMRSLSARIGQQTSAASKRFAQAFPQFDGKASMIYYLPSFYRFDGQMTKVDGKNAILFGLDGIARYHGADADLGVLFSHELFHIHHARTSPALFADEEHTPVYIGIWIEGLATYVSEQLNPQASALQVLLDDKALLERGIPRAGEIAGMILDRFDSAQPEDAGRFLSFGDKGDIPGRSGYLIGYLVAKRLGAGRTLQELAALKGERLRSLVHEEVQRLAANGGALQDTSR
jgi:hypothetical protein